jgi:hypothetical protein
MRKWLAGIALYLLLAGLVGCPAVPAAPRTEDNGDGEAFAGKPGVAQHAEPGVDPLSEAQPGSSSREIPNAKPVNGDWIWIDSLTRIAGEEIRVEYRIETPPSATRLWIGMVPAALMSSDAKTNREQAVMSMEGDVSATEAVLLPLQAGRFRLRLFSQPDNSSTLIAETPPFTVEQPAFSEVGAPPAPYVTIPAPDNATIAIQQDFPLLAHFAIPEDCPTSVWIGVVPVGTASRDLSENMKANVSYEHVQGKSSGDFVWVASVPGTYVIRLFPADNSACFSTVESAAFEVMAKLQSTANDGG